MIYYTVSSVFFTEKHPVSGRDLHCNMVWRGTVTRFTLFSPSRNGASAIDYTALLRQLLSVNAKFYRVRDF